MSMEKEPPKLDANDVRSIFEALHDSKPAPAGLKFQIVPVGPDGQGLSPPNHEYEGEMIFWLSKLFRQGHIIAY